MSTDANRRLQKLATEIMVDYFRTPGNPPISIGLPTITKLIMILPRDSDAETSSHPLLYECEDGSYLIAKVESEYRRENFLKYLNTISYTLGILEPDAQLQFLVIYTADVAYAPSSFETDCLTFRTRQIHPTRYKKDALLHTINSFIDSGEPLDGKCMYYLAIMPLGYKGCERKRESIDEAIGIALRVKDTEEAALILSIIALMNETYITDEQLETVAEMVRKAHSEELDQEESVAQNMREAEGLGMKRARARAARTIALNLLAMGQDVEFVSKATGLSEAEVAALAADDVPFDLR